jgi:hypothetical protein
VLKLPPPCLPPPLLCDVHLGVCISVHVANNVRVRQPLTPLLLLLLLLCLNTSNLTPCCKRCNRRANQDKLGQLALLPLLLCRQP